MEKEYTEAWRGQITFLAEKYGEDRFRLAGDIGVSVDTLKNYMDAIDNGKPYSPVPAIIRAIKALYKAQGGK